MDLTPYGFASEERVLAACGLGTGSQDLDKLDAAVEAANNAVAWLETTCHRMLGRRTHRAPASIACGTTIDNTGVTGAGFLALKELDDVVGIGLQPWTRVAAIASDTALTLTKKATATGTPTLTFGSEAGLVGGDGTNEIYAPEFPLYALYRAAVRDGTGAETALDITGARLERETGLIVLPNDTFPEGRLNVVLEFLAGYALPSATSRGDLESSLLQRMQLRMTRVFYDDAIKYPGRAETRTVGPITMGVRFRIPEDVAENLPKFVRR